MNTTLEKSKNKNKKYDKQTVTSHEVDCVICSLYQIQRGSNLEDNNEPFVSIIQILLWSVFQSEAVIDFQIRQALESHL